MIKKVLEGRDCMMERDGAGMLPWGRSVNVRGCCTGDADVKVLSGGERRRVAIARLVLERPQVHSHTPSLCCFMSLCRRMPPNLSRDKFFLVANGAPTPADSQCQTKSTHKGVFTSVCLFFRYTMLLLWGAGIAHLGLRVRLVRAQAILAK